MSFIGFTRFSIHPFDEIHPIHWIHQFSTYEMHFVWCKIISDNLIIRLLIYTIHSGSNLLC